MTLNKVPEPKTDKNRLHLDVISHTLDAETERLLSLGARRLGDDPGRCLRQAAPVLHRRHSATPRAG
jgi:hypothetical protein